MKPFVYVDESWCDEYYHRDHGRASRGKRIYGEISVRKYQRTNFISGLCDGKVIVVFSVDTSFNEPEYDVW